VRRVEKESVIEQKSFQFALDVIALYQKLRDEREYILSRQLLRSGTSIGANVEEAESAQSRKDFIAKMCVAKKEAREARYWLRLLRKSHLVTTDVTRELATANELLRILTSIVKTAMENLERPPDEGENS
jgi:four helix bundle protein